MGAPDPAFSGRVPPSCSPIYRLRNLSPPPAAQVPLLLKSAVRPPRCRTHSALNPEPVRISGEDSVFLPAVFALTADGGVRRPAAYSPSFRRGKGPAGSTSPFAALRKSGLSRTFASTGSPAGCAHSSGFIVGNKILLSPSRPMPLRSAQNPHNCWVFETIYHSSCVLFDRPLHSKSCIKIVVVCRHIFL